MLVQIISFHVAGLLLSYVFLIIFTPCAEMNQLSAKKKKKKIPKTEIASSCFGKRVFAPHALNR